MNQSAYPILNFLKLIGSPYDNHSPENLDFDSSSFLDFAVKNRIRLLYLNSLDRHRRLGTFQEKRNELLRKYQEIQRAFFKISNHLNNSQVKYALFKSIRPYQEVTVDIDILIFGNQYQKVLDSLYAAGYLYLGEGPLSTTFRDREVGIGLDIYDEVGVSHIIYMDKNQLEEFVTPISLSVDCTAKSLNPAADLLAVIAHSVIKEHMYVLSEYYTTLHYLRLFSEKDLSSFVSLAKECKLSSTAKTHLTITAFLHGSAHGFVPKGLANLLGMLEAEEDFEIAGLVKNRFFVPHKYHPKTVLNAFLEKSSELKARQSFAAQIYHLLNPRFASSFVKLGLDHVLRSTY